MFTLKKAVYLLPLMISTVWTSTVAAAEKPESPAYYVAEFQVHDRPAMKPYSEQVESTFKPFSGRYIARGGKLLPLEGDVLKGGVIIIQFDSLAQAQAWYDSPAYAKLKPIRHQAATSHVFIIGSSPKS